MKRDKLQNNHFHALVSKLRLTKDNKEQLVLAFSKGRTRSSAELHVEEMRQLIQRLQSMQHQPLQPKARVNFYQDDPSDKMRKKCLSLVHELGWELADGKIDWERLNAWMLKYSYLHKKLNDYKYEELPRLITQFENLLKTTYER